MRWCLYIPSILILLTLGVELCSGYGAESVKDPSRLVCVLDDDDAELKQGGLREHSFVECDPLSQAGQHVLIRWVKTDLILSLEGAEILKVCSGVRRHRWLCRECC
jgi:hypothetical protein